MKGKLTITRSFYFDAAHSLPFHDGKCKRQHGHTYRLDVTVSSFVGSEEDVDSQLLQDGPESGMIVDFTALKQVVESWIVSRFDHGNLNNYFSSPTCEVIIIMIAERLVEPLKEKRVILEKLDLWETIAPHENKCTLTLFPPS